MIAEVPGTQTALPTYRAEDHLGSLALQTDNSGNVTGSSTFLPFGQMLSSNSSDSFQFTELPQDTENSSYHAGYRNFSTEQGRWLSPDPYDGSYDLGNPQSFDRYSYVVNNPLAFNDPSGEDFGTYVLVTNTWWCASCQAAAWINPVTASILAGIDVVATIGHFLGWWGGPQFHGTLKPRPNTPDNNKPPCSANQKLPVPRELQQAMLRNEGWTLKTLTLTSNLAVNGFQAYAFRDLHLGSLDITGNTDVFVNGTPGGFSAYTLGGSVIVGNSWLGQVDVTSLQFANGAFADVHGSAGVIPGSWFGINSKIQSGLNSNPDAINAAKALSQRLDTCTY